MERLLGFLGESAEDNVLDGFIAGNLYVVDDKLLFGAGGKKNGNELALVRVADYLNLPVLPQIRLGPFRNVDQVLNLIQVDTDAAQPVQVKPAEVYFVVLKPSRI
jgi:hypothetical protein